MKILGVTGISGSGTSTVADILSERGGVLISADDLAHEAIGQGKEAYHEILREFGKGGGEAPLLTPDGEINRKALGALAFGRPDVLARLEAIIHPQVWNDTEILLQNARSQNAPFAVIDAPLLIEAGMHELCDTVILVTASDTRRAERIMERDGITIEAAVRRLASRAADEVRMPYAHIVIENDGDIVQLRQRTAEAMQQLNLNGNPA